jgi:hypothetical protein
VAIASAHCPTCFFPGHHDAHCARSVVHYVQSQVVYDGVHIVDRPSRIALF